MVTLNRDNRGVYFSPFINLDKDLYGSRQETSGRLGGLYSYLLFGYKQMECRVQAGVGVVGGIVENKYQYSADTENRQAGAEAWLQPEFRFYERFALLLEANTFRYTWEDDSYGNEWQKENFIFQNFAVSKIKIGVRYYLHSRKKA